MRIAGLGHHAWAFHSSSDGRHWNFVRLFHLPVSAETPAMVGFLSQAPFGAGCEVVFDEIDYREDLLDNLRDGS